MGVPRESGDGIREPGEYGSIEAVPRSRIGSEHPDYVGITENAEMVRDHRLRERQRSGDIANGAWTADVE